jgi:hypothetical protein
MYALFLLYDNNQIFERNRTSTLVSMYSLFLYFLDLSLCNTSYTLVIVRDEKRSYMSVWNRIQRVLEYPLYKSRVSTLNIDKTIMYGGNQ